MGVNCCSACRFGGKMLSPASRVSSVRCHRFPAAVDKDESDWCGEWKPLDGDGSLEQGRSEETARITSALRAAAEPTAPTQPEPSPQPLDGVCRACGHEMAVGGGCRVATRQAKTGQVAEKTRVNLTLAQCCDGCNAGAEQYHHMGCYREPCPFCGGLVLECDCCFR